jgi:hypothetical protein
MNLATLLIQIVLTVPLTIILNYFRNKENRRINQLLIPSVYIILVAALIPFVKENVFLIVIFELFIRNFYVTNIVSQEKEISNTTFIIEGIISIALSLFTYNFFISKVDTVIPDPESIKPFIWFLMILFSASLYKTGTKNRQEVKSVKTKKRKTEQTVLKYAKYKNIYGPIIKSKRGIINNIVYAIMIYNDSKTPKINRKLKEYKGWITRNEVEYGIMQVPSLVKISDEESIRMTINDLENRLKGITKEQEVLDTSLRDYKDKVEIINIYNEIVEFQHK